MLRSFAKVLPLTLLAACGGGSSGPAPLPTPSVRAAFAPHGLVDQIEIEAVDRLPLRMAALVGPDGTATPSGPIDVNRTERFAAGQFVANDPWRAGIAGGSGNAVLAAEPQTAATFRAQSEILATFSHASILLPDSGEYRRNWRAYRIQLTFGSAPGPVETREIPAPEPPPAR
jgi:hypothetical protein